MAAPAPLPAAAPPPAPPPPRDLVRRPAILLAFRSADPCPFYACYGATPVQAVRTLAERLRCPPVRLGFRFGPLGEVDVFDRGGGVYGQATLATIAAGLSVREARAARDHAQQGAML